MTQFKKERLSKVIARAGICSRRNAEKVITEGRVRVNNHVISTLGAQVTESDEITVDNIPLWKNPQTRLWAFYKPRGVITTHKDPQGRRLLYDLLPSTLPRVISIGRLDLMSEGLILLTNDGTLARALELPQNKIPRTYHVRIFGQLSDQQMRTCEQGITIKGQRYQSIKMTLLKQGRSNQWLEVTLYEGKNREIRKVMEWLGVKVNRLIRTSYGPVILNGLKSTEIREVSDIVPHLKHTLGL
jgi:23S rRNA pseudouridine2605 synthase